MRLSDLDTLTWLQVATEDPSRRHPDHLPKTLDLRPWAELFTHVSAATALGSEVGFPIVLREGRLHFPQDLTWQTSFPARLEGGWFVGTFHAHMKGGEPSFDPHDLGATLRSDNPGFLELLMTGGELLALVRSNPFLYISAHHVTRNPMLLAEPHAELVRSHAGGSPTREEYRAAFERATRYYLERYQLALYRGQPDQPLEPVFMPKGRWP